MGEAPLRVARQGGVLVLTLDTPRCAVNILDNVAARQLIEILAGLDRGVRAVVVRSGKPGSFINGAGLLMAMSVQRPSHAGTVSATVRRAYDAMAASPVPVVAAVRGSCYGCGVEMVLRSPLRLAADGWDTHFYMTEITEYLFTPVFGGTAMLPLTVGLPKALDLVLWGERWSGREALRHGLVHAVLPDDRFDEAVLEEVERFLAADRGPRRRHVTPGAPAAVKKAHAARIAALPPAYQEVYRDTLDVMCRAAEAGAVRKRELADEIDMAGRSARKEQSKRAMGLFLVRQTAEALARPRHETREPVRLTKAGAHPFWRELERRAIAGLVTIGARGLRCGAQGVEALDVAFALGRTGELPVGAPCVVYGPARLGRDALIEIAEPDGPTRGGDAMFHVLSRQGFKPVRTRARGFFVIDRFLRAWLEPAVIWCLGGGAPEVVSQQLREAGVVRGLDLLLPRFELARVVKLLRPGGAAERRAVLDVLSGGEGERGGARFSGGAARAAAARPGRSWRRSARKRGTTEVVDAMALEAAAVVLACLEDDTLPHPSVADVVAREIADFPLACGTLATAMTRARVGELLSRVPAALVRRDSLARLRGYVSGPRDFYL